MGTEVRNEEAECPTCRLDEEFLRRRSRPAYEEGTARIRIVDLFCGCGGMTLGAAEGARRLGMASEVALAVDNDPDAVRVFRANFPTGRVIESDVCNLFEGQLGSPPTQKERRLATEIGPVDLLLSGAPCQGHSDLNNHTRRRDPRNRLYLQAARAVQVLKPSFILLENVPAVQHDSTGVIDATRNALEACDYVPACRVINLGDLGIPQTRKRHFLLAARPGLGNPEMLLAFTSSCAGHLPRSVWWAIGDLEDAEPGTMLDTPSAPSPDNVKRIRWLFEKNVWDLPNDQRPPCHHGNHSYRSMYGRLWWDRPAQTITTGFGSMGQGRYVHPSRPRTLTPHEAARLQTFPDFFNFEAVRSRSALARLVGNAVPPLATLQLVARLLANLNRRDSST